MSKRKKVINIHKQVSVVTMSLETFILNTFYKSVIIFLFLLFTVHPGSGIMNLTEQATLSALFEGWFETPLCNGPHKQLSTSRIS